MAKIVIDYADEPAELVADLIEIIEQHAPLKQANIVCLFTNQRMKHSEKVVLGKATKQGAITKFFASGDTRAVDAGPDFVLVFNRAEWSGLSPEKRSALVDHELCHCVLREKSSKTGRVTKTWGLRGHDIEEFQDIVRRHGFAFRDDEQFAEVVKAKQLELAGKDLKEKFDADAKQPATV